LKKELNRCNSSARLKDPSPESRRNAIWSLTRIDNAAARKAVRAALKDPDQSVCLAAIHSASVWRDTGALPRLLDALKGLPGGSRAAAEALGRLGDKKCRPSLLGLRQRSTTGLEHSLTYAADRNRRLPCDGEGPAWPPAHLRNGAAMIALDQMDNSELKPEQVTPYSTAPPTVLHADRLPMGHWAYPQWGGALLIFP